MSLTPINNTLPVYATAPSGQTGYNEIRNLIVDIIGTGSNGYGYASIPSFNVSSANIITAQHWANLIGNISLIYQHHNDSLPTIANQPVSQEVIKESFVNQLITILNDVEPIRYNRPPAGQRSLYNTDSTWTVSAPSRLTWGALIEHEITLTWSSELDARYFFNLGGRLSFSLTYPSASYTGGNLEWVQLINANIDNINDFVYSRSDYISGNKSDTWDDINGNEISITYTKVNSFTINLLLSLSNTNVGTDLEATNTFTYEYSTGAITAPQPSVTVQQSLGDSTTPIVVPTKILSVSTPSAYSWVTGQTSSAQTVNITNNGNTAAAVTSITFSNASGITQVTDFTGLGGSTNFTLNPSQTKSFTLAYTGIPIGGPYTSSFTVNSDNDTGPITINTNQTITRVPFTISVVPSSISLSLSGLSTWRQDFVVTSDNGDSFTYTSSLSSPVSPPGAVGWASNDDLSTGPTLTFSPVGATLPTFTATVDLVINATSNVSGSDSVTVPVTLNLTIPVSGNLGTWVSPLAANNAVIGMSYDLIDGERYLTIGVGMGADGSVPLNVGGSSSVDVANLGVSADTDFKQGQRLYPASQASDWSPFLKALGSWPNSIPEQPYNINVGITPTYRFYAPVTGDYTYELSIDNDGYYSLLPADEYGLNTDRAIFLTPSLMNGGARSNYRQSYTGTVNLTAGWYILRYWHTNYDGPAAAAFQIKDPSGNVIWNTRYPVRSSPNYLYWQDVIRMRIPADGTARDLFSSLWYVKNTYQVSGKAHWGYYFNPDMFKVTDDGFGNLNIVLFGTARAPLLTDPNAAADKSTIKALSAAFYYYLPFSLDLIRYTNLDPGPVGDGTQTRYFSGFEQDGTVVTVLKEIPSSIPDPIPTNPNPGGGGGGGGEFEDFINQQER